MKEKWTVSCGAIDGEWEKHFNTKDEAIKYANEWAGDKVFPNFSGDSHGVSTENGRMSVHKSNIGTCPRCHKKNKSLHGLLLRKEGVDGWDDRSLCERVEVCSDCGNSFECHDGEDLDWYRNPQPDRWSILGSDGEMG